jgi:hypothetical protein
MFKSLENIFNFYNAAVYCLTSRQFEHHPEALNSVVMNSPLPAIVCFLRSEKIIVANYKKDVSMLFAE